MINSKKILSFLAHPDDTEILCAGTLALLRQKGWEIHIATMTPGDCGSAKLDREQISRVRRAEATAAAEMLDGNYHCLECDDIFFFYDRPTLLKAITLFRRLRPTLVFTHSSCDYMLDHEMASRIAQTACFSSGLKNIDTPGAEPFEPIPYLYYLDPVECKDKYGREVEPNLLVDISSVMDTKEKMLCAHDSQRQWLMVHHGMDEYVESMKTFGRHQGEKINVTYAEGFRQHLGHSFPQENLLQSELGELAHLVK